MEVNPRTHALGRSFGAIRLLSSQTCGECSPPALLAILAARWQVRGMGTPNAGTKWADDLDWEISRAFEQIKRPDDEDPSAAALADDDGFMIVIWPDEFQ
jgi:hypothetical protein